MNKYEVDPVNRISLSLLVVLFVLALLPRITGLITYENLDENWGGSVRVLTGELSGGTSQTLPLINYLNAASFVVLYALGRLIGVWHTAADFRAQYFADRTPFVFAGRFVAACLGAFSAPLAALVASRLGLSRKSSIIVGAMVAIFPINVWLSHFSKPDSGVAFGVLLLVWSLLRKLGNAETKGPDLMVGVALAIVVSFKQTAVFLLAPALVGFVALLRWDLALSWSRIARGLLASLVACVVAWAPMNIGVLRDIHGFLDYQRATAVVMSRQSTAYQIAEHVIPMLAGNIDGLTAVGFLLWLIVPIVRRDAMSLILWGSTAFAYVVFSFVSGGTKTVPRYFLPYDELAFTLGCIAALSLAGREGRSRFAGIFLVVAVLASEAVGSITVMRQAITAPLSTRCSEILERTARPDHDRILTASLFVVGVPIDPAATDEDYRRDVRLAEKYRVKLPAKAADKKTLRPRAGGGYFVRRFPAAMGGMEDLEQDRAESAVKPFWWPIQEEEYNLDYWTALGFDIFVVRDEAGMLASKVPQYRSFHQQIKDRCELVAVLPSQRTLFSEGELKIYRLPGPGGREQPPTDMHK